MMKNRANIHSFHLFLCIPHRLQINAMGVPASLETCSHLTRTLQLAEEVLVGKQSAFCSVLIATESNSHPQWPCTLIQSQTLTYSPTVSQSELEKI